MLNSQLCRPSSRKQLHSVCAMGVRNLDGLHLRLHFSVFRHQEPSLPVASSRNISRDSSLVHRGNCSTVVERLHPFRFQGQRKRRFRLRRNHDALQSFTHPTVFDIILLRRFPKVATCRRRWPSGKVTARFTSRIARKRERNSFLRKSFRTSLPPHLPRSLSKVPSEEASHRL